jgi:hypothetical protein
MRNEYIKNERNILTELDEKIRKDVGVLAEFINIYCSDKHHDVEKGRAAAGGEAGRYAETVDFEYCRECRGLLLHALSRRLICPYDPKPSCKKCPTHCYGPGYRDRIREVMRYSGMRLIGRGRFDLIKKYFS